RPVVAFGLGLLMFNTWQLSHLTADTSIPWLLVLTTARGAAIGFVVQTTLVTALSSVDPQVVFRASSLTNGTRFLIQSLGIAFLVSLLIGEMSPETKSAFYLLHTNSVGTPLCATVSALCTESLSGFSRTYGVGFALATAAGILSLFLPGFPKEWRPRA